MEIKKGEAVLIKSDKSFEDRVDFINETFTENSDVVILKNKTIAIDDIRNFQNEFQKSSNQTNVDFNKLGIIIFDNISEQAQNSLLKILEDIDKENCIVLYINKNVKLLSTVLSRVVSMDEGIKKSLSSKNKKPELPDLNDKENPIDKQKVIEWIKYTIENSKINKDKKPLIWINGPSPNIKYIIEYVNLFY
jgi:DNA polymerase III delta prime subunit